MLLGSLAVIPLMIGSPEILVIAGVVLLLFGGKKIPEFMKSLGQGVSYFKKGLNEDVSERKSSVGVEDEVLMPQENDAGWNT